jgi:exonuclease III
MHKIYTLLFLLCVQVVVAQATLKTMVYNLLEFPSAPPVNRELILKDIFASYLPDLFMVNELQNEVGANLILNQSLLPLDANYARSTFAPNQSSSFQDLNQMVFFNTEKLILEDEELFETTVRDINHFTFKLNTLNQATNPVFLHVYVTHLKADAGADTTDDQQIRLDMVNVFTNQLNNLPPNSFVLFAGDLNLKTASEAAYQELLDPTNAIVLVDPINRPGDWSNSQTFADIHTQSTRTSTANFGGRGSGGGLDDRFDFILMSQNLQTSTTLNYIDGSYKAFGNNGNCRNLNINDVNCTGDFSQPLRDLLFNMSDHLPVIADFQINEPLLSITEVAAKPLLRFPSGNVVSNALEIALDVTQLQGNEWLMVYNTVGQVIQQVNVGLQRQLQLETTSLSKGLYFIKLQGHSNQTWKFIKK